MDPDEYVNVAAFAADPTGQKRLRAEVRRVVKEQKLSKTPVTWEETREAAASIGADDLVKKGEASPLSRPEMLAARNVIQANTRLQAKLLRERASRIDLSRSREEEITRTLGAIRAQNDALLGSFIKSRSEAGRALNSLKILASQDLDPSPGSRRPAPRREAASPSRSRSRSPVWWSAPERPWRREVGAAPSRPHLPPGVRGRRAVRCGTPRRRSAARSTGARRTRWAGSACCWKAPRQRSAVGG